MRLALRRDAAARDAQRPTAAFAAILDGQALWLAVSKRAGRLALRHSDSGAVVDLPHEEVTDQPAYLAARLDLADLDGREATHDVVLLPPGDLAPVVVRTEPLPPVGTRTSADGRTHHTLVRTSNETLRLHTTVLPAAAGLLAVRKLPEAVELTLVDAGPELAILDDSEQVLVSWPVEPAGVVTITHEHITGLGPITRPAMTGRPGAWKPVRRRANDLLDPRAAAPLPQVDHPHADQPLLRLPWSRDALLLIRVFPLDAVGDQP